MNIRRAIQDWLLMASCEICEVSPAVPLQLSGSVWATLCTRHRTQLHEHMVNWPENLNFLGSALQYQRAQRGETPPAETASVIFTFIEAERILHDRVMDWIGEAE